MAGLKEKREYIRTFVPFVNFLAEILGSNSEVLLNDLTDLDHSVVAIKNATISHRKVGDPATDLALETMKSGQKNKQNFLANYQSVGQGGHVLRSSTFFIRFQDELIAMICINTDDSILNGLDKTISDLVSEYSKLKKLQASIPEEEVNQSEAASLDMSGKGSHTYVETEHLTTSIQEIANSEVSRMCDEQSVSVDYLKLEDKIEIIRRLYHRGYFLLKDAVSVVASLIQVSEPTVYRYLQSVKQERTASLNNSSLPSS